MTTTISPSDEAQGGEGSGFRAVGAAVGLLLAGMLVNVGVGVAAILVFGMESVQQAGTGFYVSAILGQGLVFVVAFAYLWWRSLDVPTTVPSSDESLVIGGSVVASVVAALALSVLRQRFVPTDTTSALGEIIVANPELALVVGGLSVVLIAPAEELLFRGAIQGRLGQVFGPAGAIGGASTLFAAWHLLNFQGSVIGILLTAATIGAVSLLWGYAYERTDNFAVPVLTHGFYNLTLLLITYAQL